MDAPPKNERKALGFALYTVLAWSSVATAFKVALRHGDVFFLVFFASAVSTVTLFTLFFLSGTGPGRPGRGIWLGLLNPLAYYIVLLAAYDRLSAQHALALNYSWVLVLAALSVPLLKQPFSRKLALALLSGYLGVWVIATNGTFTAPGGSLAGVLLALLSTFIWAITWLLNTRAEGSPLNRLAWQFLPGTIGAGVLWLVFGSPFSARAFAGAAYIGVMEMGLTFFTWLMALRLTERPARLSALVFLTPVLSLLWIRLVLEEPLSAVTLGGITLILAGIGLSRLPSR